MILRFLNIQGIAGIAVGVALAVLLVVQKVETRHWKKQSDSFEQLYRKSETAFAETIANVRAAADLARAADQAKAARVEAAQRTINERTAHDFETRLAAARARANALGAQRLRLQPEAAADPGAGRAASLPGVPAAAGGSRPRRRSTFWIGPTDRDRAGDPARRADQMGSTATRGRHGTALSSIASR
jgi:signal transduction histidine kinase